MIDKDYYKKELLKAFDEVKNRSGDEHIQKTANAIKEVLWASVANPLGNEFEYGLMTGYLSIYLVLSAYYKEVDEVQNDLELIIDTYMALLRGTELPENGKKLIAYYAQFGKVAPSD